MQRPIEVVSPDRAVVRRTASSLLAQFLPNKTIEHKMVLTSPTPREKSHVSYSTSDSSTSSGSQSQEFEGGANEFDDGYEEGKDDEIQYEERKPPTRRSSRRLGLQGSTRAKVSGRTAVRQEIASVTKAKRDRFFVEKKNYFLPLLPTNSNYVKKLVEQYESLGSEGKADISGTIPYAEIVEQPRGIKATMKPYQLAGLSFMVYLHRNGLSGILGDEMGLGKTLQALSLIQYLKENEPITGSEQRPFLVICPLSVLSSWIAEARKWTPGLKVLRFHGPAKERDRLKKVAVGEVDMSGNLSSKQKTKSRARRAITGTLDSELEEGASFDLVVTTYDAYMADHVWFKRAFVWRYIILDEGHKVKNDTSLISKALQGLQAEYRLILTGTPLQNNLSELWALLHWLYWDVFTDSTYELFRKSFDLSKGQVSKTVLEDARRLLEVIMLRRMKNSPGVDLNLPPKTEVLLFVPLSPMQRFWYTRLITRADQALLHEIYRGASSKEQAAVREEEISFKAGSTKKSIKEQGLLAAQSGFCQDEWEETATIIAQTIQREKDTEAVQVVKNSAWQKLMNLLMQLRKVCNHPYQIPNAAPDPYELGEHVIQASGKFMALEKLVDELVKKQKRKILIFSGFTRMLDLVEDLLLLRGGDGTSYRFLRLDGSTARARRNLGIRIFNDVTSNYRIMLISTRAGGLGINLAAASDVVLLDQDWNPQITLQAEARAHRIGQTKPVTIYKLLSQGTVEEQMMGRIQKKLYLSAKVTEAMRDMYTQAGNKKGRVGDVVRTNDDVPELSTGQLMSLIRRGTSALSRPEVDINQMLSWDWETMVRKCKDQPADAAVKSDSPDAGLDQEAEQNWLSEMERVESYIFEGKRLERKKESVGLSVENIVEEQEKAGRRVGKNTTVMMDGFAINKESMLCKDWEAVPTMAGKDPRLAEPKRAKMEPVNSQSHCQICYDGGELHLCQRCPRAYHYDCLEAEFKSKTRGGQFICPQHQCYDCEQKTTDAGGMLYRCRYCELAFCEDCMDWEKTVLIGDSLVEYDILAYPEQAHAFYIQCHICTDHFINNPGDRAICEAMAQDAQRDYEVQTGRADTASRAESMTDAATIETTGAITPQIIDDDEVVEVVAIQKRKAKVITKEKTHDTGRTGPSKRLKIR